MADENDLLRRYYANPALHPVRDEIPLLPPLPDRRPELRNHAPRPGDAMAPVAEMISPTMAGYGMGSLAGDTYNKSREGDWRGVAANLPELAMAAVPMPGMKGTTRTRRLSMDPAAVAARQEQMGFHPETYYHGTTHKYKEVADPAAPHSPYEPDSYHGPAFYMSSSPSDSRGNYAGIGPDLSNRIERHAENYIHDIEGDPARRALALRAKRIEHLIPDYWSRTPDQRLAWSKAYSELVGKHGEFGHTMELRTNMRNPVYVGGPKDTFFALEHPEYRVEPRRNEFDVIDPQGNVVRSFPDEHVARDHAFELSYEGDVSGPGAKILELARQPLSDAKDLPAWRLEAATNRHFADKLYENMMDRDGIRASELEALVRRSDLTDAYGDMINPGKVLQDWYRALGHDAAVLVNADQKFPGMGMAPGTNHVALFDPRRVRDVNAKFDPAKIDSKNLMAGIAGAGAAGLTTADILRQYGDEKEKPDG